MGKLRHSIMDLGISLASPFTLASAFWLKTVRKYGRSRVNDGIFMKLGVLPVLDHYYQPLINPQKHLKKSLRADRMLPGIKMNAEQQLKLLSCFNYNDELLRFPIEKSREKEYYYNNGSFGSGDGEYLYNIIRHYKPRNIIEIGSGSSTLMARNAIRQNTSDNPDYKCNHTCIEPYEQDWLEQIEVKVIRERVEDIDAAIFSTLEENDILFIDSSHIIRPQGDVLVEFLEILPLIKPGVLVHVHDIFTPKDYPNDWVYKMHRMWNEQYLLEAFLSFNDQFRIIGALNFLTHNHRDSLAAKCPVFEKQPAREPGSFWMVRNK